MMILFLPNCSFLSEVSRSLQIAEALRARGVEVAFGSRGGRYQHLIESTGMAVHPLEPAVTSGGEADFLAAILAMGPRTSRDFYGDEELRTAVEAEVALIRRLDADLAVTGFSLSAYLSTRLAGVPLATDHGGSYVPPVLAHGLCPVPVNPPDPNVARLPRRVQHWIANRAPAFIHGPVDQLNRLAREHRVDPLPSMLGLMCGDLTLVTDLPNILGLPARDLESWRPRWPLRVRTGTTFRYTGPLYARLDIAVPEAVEAFLGHDEPVVYVALTSVSESLLRRVVASAQRTGHRILVAGGEGLVDDVGGERTLVCGTLPSDRVMPRVAAAVVMGGQGSTQTAMASATPFVGLPYHGEQELNVAVAERLGSAIRMSPVTAGTPSLTEAIDRLISEPAFSSAAAEVATRYAGVDGGARAADVIVDYLTTESARRAPAVT